MAHWDLFVGFPIEIEETGEVLDYHSDVLADLEALVGKLATEQVVDGQLTLTWNFKTEAQGNPAYEKVLGYLKGKDFAVGSEKDEPVSEDDDPRFTFDVTFEQDE